MTPFPVPSLIDSGNWAFFPLFPMIVGSVHFLTSLPVMVIATAVSILLSGAAALVAWPLLERNLRAYTLYCAFLLCGPFSIYFTTFYTEVLFVLLTNCVFLAVKRGNYLAAGGLAALLSATRIVGVFIVFAIALQYVLDFVGRGGRLRGLLAEVWRRPEIVLALLIAPLGLFAYMAYLHFYMGDALAFSHVQRAWGQGDRQPADLPVDRPHRLAEDWFPAVRQPGPGALGARRLALSVLLLIRRQYAAAAFCLICLVVPLSAGMASMLRFVAALSPIVLALMLLLARWQVVFVIALLGFVVADYAFTVGWLEEWLALV